MNERVIIFELNDTEKIVLQLEESVDHVDYCYRADILLLQSNQQALLSADSIHYSINRFSDFLKKVLNEQQLLHESLADDIGYLCNEYYQDETGFVIEELVGGSTWVGYKYHLWEAYANKIRLMTWLYNDTNGSIIFEVTPCYPYLYSDPEEEPDYIPYEEWIKTYKPYFIREISIVTAQEWFKQAEYIVKTIENNIERWETRKIIK